MEQMLIYSFVARGTVILAEYIKLTGNFIGIASEILQKLPASNTKFTHNCDGYAFNYLIENGFTFCVVATLSAGTEVPMAFLERVKDDFNKRYERKATTAMANSLSRDFGPRLKEQMQYCVDHPEEVSKLAQVQAQVSDVKDVMRENIEKALDRGVKLDQLIIKTEELQAEAKGFEKKAKGINRNMWLKNVKIKLVVLGIIIVVILIIILSVCNGFNC